MSDGQPVTSLVSRTRRLRDHINRNRINAELARDFRTFNQLCTCLDTIDDTEMAIEAFLQGSEADSGELYLALYGFMQALYIQQDAARYLCESIGVPFPGWRNPVISEIREVRDIRDDVSHPTQRQPVRNGPVSFHSIVRSMMRRSGFTIVSEDTQDESRSYRYINTSSLWAKQAPAIGKLLDLVITTLEERDRQHREAFMSTKLADIVSAVKLSYDFEKILEEIRGEGLGMGTIGIERIAKAIMSLRDELNRRGYPIDGGLKYIFEELEHPLEVTLAYFGIDASPYIPLLAKAETEEDLDNIGTGDAMQLEIDPQTARVFVEYIEYKVRELHEAAVAIDEDYAGNDQD
ncbi:MAG TPA: hypothetical protein VGL77_13065 [Armatimonadota bacterium]|jgi:hypothetical protein